MKAIKNENEQAVSADWKKLWMGIGNFKVIAVNPDAREKEELLGLEEGKIEKEPEYAGTKDDIDWALLEFWVQADHPSKPIFQARYRLMNKKQVSKAGKPQFVATNGDNTWSTDESTMLDSFKYWQIWNKPEKKFVNIIENGSPIEKNYREAIVGEADLYEFLRQWYSHAEWEAPSDNSMLIDVKKLFRDPTKFAKSEYGSNIGTDLVDDIIGIATIYVTEKDGEKKQYQNISKFWLSNGKKDEGGKPVTMKKVNNLMQTNSWDSAEYLIKKWHKEATDPSYGIRENYKMIPLQEYDPSLFINEGNETLVHSEGTSIDNTDY